MKIFGYVRPLIIVEQFSHVKCITTILKADVNLTVSSNQAYFNICALLME